MIFLWISKEDLIVVDSLEVGTCVSSIYGGYDYAIMISRCNVYPAMKDLSSILAWITLLKEKVYVTENSNDNNVREYKWDLTLKGTPSIHR